MYCQNCGSENQEGNQFCTFCGKPLAMVNRAPDQAPRSRGTKKKLVSIIVACVAVASMIAGSVAIYAVNTILPMKKAEETANRALHCVASGDLQGLWETMGLSDTAQKIYTLKLGAATVQAAQNVASYEITQFEKLDEAKKEKVFAAKRDNTVEMASEGSIPYTQADIKRVYRANVILYSVHEGQSIAQSILVYQTDIGYFVDSTIFE